MKVNADAFAGMEMLIVVSDMKEKKVSILVIKGTNIIW